MSAVSQTSDTDLLELLRMIGPTNVSELSRELDVTPTAVRQRLTRLPHSGNGPTRGDPRAAAVPVTATN